MLILQNDDKYNQRSKQASYVPGWEDLPRCHCSPNSSVDFMQFLSESQQGVLSIQTVLAKEQIQLKQFEKQE